MCLACTTGSDLADWRRIGTALGQLVLPVKKRPDAVDAWVALAAHRHGSAVVFTSDPDDLHAYLEFWRLRMCMWSQFDGATAWRGWGWWGE